MNTPSKILLLLISLLAGRAMASPDAAEASAELTARNMAYVSSAVSAFEKGLNTTATARAAHILAVRKQAYAGHQISSNEVAVLQRTDGADIVKLYEALCEYGDKAALASSQAALAAATAKAEIAASYTPINVSTEKLDRAAKTLASLAKEQSDAERAQFFVQFLNETRDETKRLLEASIKALEKTDAQVKSKVVNADADTAKAPLSLKKD